MPVRAYSGEPRRAETLGTWAFSHVAQSSLSLPFFFFLNLFIYNRAESWSLSTVFL